MCYYWKIRENKKLEKWSRAENNKVEQCLDVDYWLSYNYFFLLVQRSDTGIFKTKKEKEQMCEEKNSDIWIDIKAVTFSHFLLRS